MEEYIRLEEERAQSRGEMFNWQNARFGRMEILLRDEDFTDFDTEFPAIILGSTNAISSQTSQGTTMREYEVEKEDSKIEFPTIFLNDSSTSKTTLSHEPTVSLPCKNKIDFRISFDESDDEDYTSPSPMASNFDDLDYYDFENKFPAIIYNDGLTYKSDPVIKPSRNRKNDDVKMQTSENNTKRSYELLKTSLDKISENFKIRDFIMELNVYVVTWNHYGNEIPLRLFKNLYVPFGIPFDPKQYYKDGAHANIAVAKSLKPISLINHSKSLLPDMAPLPHYNPRHPWLRYQVEGYTEDIVHDFERRIETIWDRSVNRVHILDFEGLTPEMRRSMTWRQFILVLGLHTEQKMAHVGFGAYWTQSERIIPDKGDLRDYWIEISSDRDFLGAAPTYVHILRQCEEDYAQR
ncbi:hypothetical protein Tco_0317422 [Tanacetum coccineum]